MKKGSMSDNGTHIHVLKALRYGECPWKGAECYRSCKDRRTVYWKCMICGEKGNPILGMPICNWKKLDEARAEDIVCPLLNLLFIRNPNYDNAQAERILDAGIWGWAIKVADFPKVKEEYPEVSWQVTDVDWTEVVAYDWIKADSWICRRDWAGEEKPKPQKFNPLRHIAYMGKKRFGDINYDGGWEGDYFYTPYAVVYKGGEKINK